MFTAGDDGSLELLTQGPAPRHPAPVYEQAPYLPANPSISGGACTCLNPYACPYYLYAKTSQGRPIEKIILWPSTGTSSSSSSEETPNRDFAEDYPEIGGSTC
jgi:hypothetical protein